MSRFAPLLRLAIFLALALWLGQIVLRLPERMTLSLPDRGVVISVPNTLEGWRLEPGEGEILLRGQTRSGLISLEIAAVPIPQNGDIDGYIQERHQQLKAGKEEYIVWHQGIDSKFGRRPAPTYKATYRDRFLGPLKAEVWVYETYWPYRGHYARISLRYPDFLRDYFYPDRQYIGAALQLEP